ncbi:hypothetical protein ACOSQ3_026386 [Xanthoceras sorbifolium]
MGRPGTGSSPYLPQQQQPQNQSEYELQAQENQYGATHEAIASGDHEVELTYESNDHYVEENQSQQEQPPPPQQQQQPTQVPQPQINQAYGAQPPRNNQMYQNGQNHQPRGAYPPASPQNNQMYHPGAYQQQGQENAPAKPEQYPPPSPRKSPMFQNEQSRSPAAYPPPMQAPQAIPVNYPPTMGYHQQTPPEQGVQFQQTNGQQYVGSSVPGIPMQNTGGLQHVPGIVSHSQKGWSSGLFDCMNDPMNAVITALFPCLTFGQIAEIIDEGHTSCGTSGMLYGAIAFCIALPCIMSCTYRTKLRSKLDLPEAPAPDWITHFLCEWCALCQEYRELQSRGWDPSIGWQGNLARNQNMNQQQVAMMPPMNQTMMG